MFSAGDIGFRGRLVSTPPLQLPRNAARVRISVMTEYRGSKAAMFFYGLQLAGGGVVSSLEGSVSTHCTTNANDSLRLTFTSCHLLLVTPSY